MRKSKRPVEKIINELVIAAIAEGKSWYDVLSGIEKAFIEKTLFETKGGLILAANIMGIHRNNFGKKMRVHNVDAYEYRRLRRRK